MTQQSQDMLRLIRQVSWKGVMGLPPSAAAACILQLGEQMTMLCAKLRRAGAARGNGWGEGGVCCPTFGNGSALCWRKCSVVSSW